MRRSFYPIIGIALLIYILFAQSGCYSLANPQIKADPLDTILTRFAEAVTKLDVKEIEKLFLPPDETPAGVKRKNYLNNIRQAWQELRETDQRFSVSFEDTKKIIRTMMIRALDEEPTTTIPIELEVVFTEDGWKIVSIDYL